MQWEGREVLCPKPVIDDGNDRVLGNVEALSTRMEFQGSNVQLREAERIINFNYNIKRYLILLVDRLIRCTVHT